jgi:hypothetical protein
VLRAGCPILSRIMRKGAEFLTFGSISVKVKISTLSHKRDKDVAPMRGRFLELFAALEKRTCGDFLDADPPHQRRCSEKAGCEGFNGSRFYFETLKLCHFETLGFPYLRMPSLVMTVL